MIAFKQGNSVRQFAAALSLFGLLGTAAFAAPITYIFSGSSVSGTLGGTAFTNAQVTITATGDTSTVPDVPDCGVNPGVPCNAPLTVTFNIAGVGSGTITDSLLIFDNHSSTGLGLERRSGGGDWLDIVNAQFGSYGLVTAIGPLTVAALSTPGSFGAVATTAGNLTLTTTPDTFQATGGVGGISAPMITKSFGAASILLNGSTSLSFTISNPNASTSLSGISVSDSLPAGLVISTPNGLTGSCGGGTITAVAGSGTISLSGASLAGAASCTFSVNVTGTSGGAKNNTTGTISSTQSGAGGTASASVTVAAAATLPPTIAKSFGAGTIVLNASTSLSFTIHNPNASATLSGIGFTDSLPSGLVVSTPNGLTGNCGGGTITATAGSGTVSLSGASLGGSASCTFSVNVAGTTIGAKNNTTGAVTSNEGGTGGTASASVNVTSVAPPPASGQPIPTLQEWALWLLAMVLLVGGVAALRSRRRE